MSQNQTCNFYLEYFLKKYIEAVDTNNGPDQDYFRYQIKKEKEYKKETKWKKYKKKQVVTISIIRVIKVK